MMSPANRRITTSWMVRSRPITAVAPRRPRHEGRDLPLLLDDQMVERIGVSGQRRAGGRKAVLLEDEGDHVNIFACRILPWRVRRHLAAYEREQCRGRRSVGEFLLKRRAAQWRAADPTPAEGISVAVRANALEHSRAARGLTIGVGGLLVGRSLSHLDPGLVRRRQWRFWAGGR